MPAARRIAHYEVVSELGRGAQGQVFLAQDTRLGRRVALKVLSSSFSASTGAVQRFRREAEAASKLDHPGICSVYEAGEWQGQHFIAMRYVEGETLAGRIAGSQRAASTGAPASGSSAQAGDATVASDVPAGTGVPAAAPVSVEAAPAGDSSTGPANRAEIFAVVALIERAARALHAAHEVGLIHRDIKPGNLLVGQDGEPVILDFGLARDESDGDSITMSGDLLGTPAYMSPEQLLAQRVRLDRRTDVYSLGVTLYECLTLRRPYDAASREALYQQILAAALPDPVRFNRHLPRDLKVVLETALEKDRDRRYATALDFAEDLRRVRCFEPILARPAGPWLRFQRWVQRNPVAATVVAGIFLLLTTALTLTMVLLQRVRQEEQVSSLQATEAKRALELVREKSEVVAATLVKLEQASELREKAVQDLGAALKRAEGLTLAAQAAGVLNQNPGLALLLGLEAAKTQEDAILRNSLIEILKAHREERALTLSTQISTASALSPAGGRLLAASPAGCRVIDSITGATVCVLGTDQAATQAYFSGDGNLVLLLPYWVNNPTVWDARTGARVATLRGHTSVVGGAAFDAKGSAAVTVAHDGTGRIFRLPSGELTAEFAVGRKISLHQVHFSPDGELVVAASESLSRTYEFTADGRTTSSSSSYSNWPSAAYVINARSGALVHTLGGHHGKVHAALSPDGKLVFTGASSQRRPRIWSLSTGEVVAQLSGGRDVDLALFAPDSRSVLVASTGRREADIHDPATGAVRLVLRGHTGPIVAVAWSADGTRCLTGARDNTARLWDARSGEPLMAFRGHEAAPFLLAFGPTPGSVISAAEDGSVRAWDARAERGFARVNVAELPPEAYRFAPDGRRLVSMGTSTMKVLDTVTGSEVFRIDAARRVDLLGWFSLSGSMTFGSGFCAVSADSSRLLVERMGSKPGWEVWDLASGKRVSRLKTPKLPEWSQRVGTISPNGRITAVITHPPSAPASRQGVQGTPARAPPAVVAEVYDADSGVRQVAFELDRDFGSPSAMAFGAAGTRLMVAMGSGGFMVFDVAAGRELWKLARLPAGALQDAHLSPNGKLVACRQWGAQVSLFDGDTGAPGAVLGGHDALVRSVEFSSDSTRIVTASEDRTARVWDTAGGEELVRVRGHAAAVHGARFSNDGRYFLTASDDQSVKVWDLRPGAGFGREIVTLPHDERVRAAVFDAAGEHVATITEREIVYRWPLDVVAEATRRKTRELTAAERERFQIGSEAERKEHRFQVRIDEQMTELASIKPRLRDPESAASVRSSVTAVLGALWTLASEDGASPRLRAALPQADAAIREALASVAAHGQSTASEFAALGTVLTLGGHLVSAVAALEAGERIAGWSVEIHGPLEAARKQLFPLPPSFASIDAAFDAAVTVVAPGSSWKYFRGKSEPSPALEWIDGGFDDSAWESGPGGFGYGDHDDATVLADMRDGYTTVYLRHVFTVDDPAAYSRLVVAAFVDDGFVVYLNGQEVGRLLAGEPGSRLPATATADSEAPEPLTQSVLDVPAGAVVAGRNVLAIQVLNRSLRSSDLSCVVELGGELAPSAAEDVKRLERVREALAGAEHASLRRYLEARMLERAGDFAAASAIFAEQARAEPRLPEPVLALARCQRLTRRPGEAEAALRSGIERGLEGGLSLWSAWLESAAFDLGWPAVRLHAAWPRTTDPLLSFHGGRIQEALAVLAAGSVLRFRCGGGELKDSSGNTWRADSFFTGGNAGSPSTTRIAVRSPDAELYTSHRWFPEPRGRDGYPGYRLPVLPGRYRVTLHFAETYHTRGGRQFDVVAAGKRVLERYDAFRAGPGTPDRQTFEVDVNGAWLGLELVRRAGNPMVSAIELAPLAVR